MYEEQANNGRRLWMKLRAWSETETPSMNAAGESYRPTSRAPVRSPSPLEYQSDTGEDQSTAVKRGHDGAVTPAVIDLTEAEPNANVPQPPVDPPSQKSTSKVCLRS